MSLSYTGLSGGGRGGQTPSTVVTVLQAAAEGQPLPVTVRYPSGEVSTCHWTTPMWSQEANRERTWGGAANIF